MYQITHPAGQRTRAAVEARLNGLDSFFGSARSRELQKRAHAKCQNDVARQNAACNFQEAFSRSPGYR